MRVLRCGLSGVSVALALAVGARGLAAQQLTGFTSAATAREHQLEAVLRRGADTASAQLFTRTLAGRPHVAGTPAQRTTADFVLRQMASWGLDTSRVTFNVFLPHQDSAVVERITPTRLRLDLSEPPVPGDPTTQLPDQWPAMNGGSGNGDVTAPLVYANYGLPSDYAKLDSLGVMVQGRIVIARYGRSFRGIKAREAQGHGAAGLILYSDPADDGFARGAVYPAGPYRNANGVQRGSIFNGEGDPTTPGWPSTPDARRIAGDSLGTARIPVTPIGYGNAETLMRDMGGPAAPTGWQGAMKFPYHLGDGTVTVRLGVWAERGARAMHDIYDTFGTIRGSEFPDQMVIIGGHRDAWGPGANDNVSGSVSVLEAARAWGTALKAGFRPRRTIVFATWDAEEWGLVGSTEWVEWRATMLRDSAVAYINQDESASGTSFGASGTASLQQLVRDVVRTVQAPGDTVSVFRKWAVAGRGRRGRGAQADSVPAMGDLGGGSDFGAFYNGLGIPSLDYGFGGGAGGSYHSAYDTYTEVERFADPGYRAHAAEGRIDAVMLARLADADVVPYDFAMLGDYLGELVKRTVPNPAAHGLSGDEAALTDATRALATAGRTFDAARAVLLARGAVPGDRLRRVNALLLGVEQQLTRQQGLVGRPGMKNLVFASDRDNGYANIALPSIAEALRDGDDARAGREVRDFTAHVVAATAQVNAAVTALQ
jgi:N-acetylated-alpha-linked acidic dipeptidase